MVIPKSGWRSEVADLLVNVFLKYTAQVSQSYLVLQGQFHRLPMVRPLIILQLNCCHPFQIEDHSWELHQDVEDQWEDEDEVGVRILLWRTAPKFPPSRSRYSRTSRSTLSFICLLSFQYVQYWFLGHDLSLDLGYRYCYLFVSWPSHQQHVLQMSPKPCK